jgi:hypothetical protein
VQHDHGGLEGLDLRQLAARYRDIDFARGQDEDADARADLADRIAAEVLRRVPDEPGMLFDRGLLAKFRRDWTTCQQFSLRALDALPEEEHAGHPAAWNLGIAATARCDWATARRAWTHFGVPIGGAGGEPVVEDFGPAPVRLNPDPRYIGQRALEVDGRPGEIDVVWGIRLDPARIQIVSVPLPESRHRHGDVVLHDGEPRGTRTLGEDELPVFDELELWRRCPRPTLSTVVHAPGDADVHELTDAFYDAGLAGEDWTTGVRVLCAACSEGSPGPHDHPSAATDGDGRTIGISAEPAQADRVLAGWAAARPGRSATPVTVELE